MSWNKHAIHILDFEGNRRTGVVEYGVITFKDEKIEQVLTGYCRPNVLLAKEDIAVHGIEPGTLLHEEPFRVHWELFKKLRQTGVLCAHCASVESRLLRDIWPLPGHVPDFIDESNMGREWGPWLDTLALYRVIYPDLESYRLSDLIEIFELKEKLNTWTAMYCPAKRKQYHAALYDALACACLLENLVKQPGFEGVTLPWLLRYSTVEEEKMQGQMYLDM